MLGISPQELLALLSARDQDMVMESCETTTSDEGIRRTLRPEQLGQLLDRSELYEKWDQDRRRRKRMEDGKEDEGDEEEEEEKEEEEEEEEEEDAEVDAGEGEGEGGVRSQNGGVFRIVETTVGVQAEDLL